MWVRVAECAGGEIVAGNGLEAEHEAGWFDAVKAEQEPVAEIERRAGHRCCVVHAAVILEALGQRVEVRKRELAGDGAEERVLLVHGLQGGDVKVGQADRDDDGGESASGAHIEDGHGSGLRGCEGGGAEMGHELETIDDVIVELVLAPRRRQIDPLIPFVK